MALKAIQTAVKTLLTADTTLTGLLATSILDGTSPGIFNDVPENQEYPFVLIGTGTIHPWHTFGGANAGLGWNDTVSTHVFSRYQGELEALNILERIMALMAFQSIAVSGYATAIFELDEARVLVEQVDKIETYHIPAVWRVKVHQ